MNVLQSPAGGNSIRGHSTPDSCHCFLDSISHVLFAPHVKLGLSDMSKICAEPITGDHREMHAG